MDYAERAAIAVDVAREAGALALDYFGRLDSLAIDSKGPQDFVTEADREVELLVRRRLREAAGDDAVVGEEHEPSPGASGVTWVIDPIDGTANFVTGMPAWCVAIAVVSDGRVRAGVIHDPNRGETFAAAEGGGATLNGAPIRMAPDAAFDAGTISVGASRRSPPDQVAFLVRRILEEGGMFQRIGSGAIGLAYVAAGRYVGYAESYMNAWDCLAGQLLISEAGGVIEDQDADELIARGGRVVAGAPGVFPKLLELTEEAFGGGAG